MEVVDRKSINDDLIKYDYLAIAISDDKLISLSYGTLDAIDYLVKTLKYKE